MQIINEKIINLTKPILSSLGLEILNVNIKGKVNTEIEIMIDKIDHSSVSLKDCKIALSHISTLLYAEKIIENQFSLNVTSPGHTRPLFKIEDYKRFLGRKVKIKLKEKFNDQISYAGYIAKVENDLICIDIMLENIEQKSVKNPKKTASNMKEEKLIFIPFYLISKANLLFDEAMIKKILKR